jgi:hypothetical protein
MSVLQTDQVVATILRWPNDNAIACLLQLGDSPLKGNSRNRGRIGVNKANAPKTAGQKVLHRRKKPLPETIAALRDQSKITRQKIIEKTFIANRRIRDHPGCTT